MVGASDGMALAVVEIIAASIPVIPLPFTIPAHSQVQAHAYDHQESLAYCTFRQQEQAWALQLYGRHSQ